jgi:hypothetical protein
MLVKGPWVRPLVDVPLLARSLTVMVSLLFLGLLIYRVKQFSEFTQTRDYAFSLVCIAMILLSPLSWQNILTMMVLPIGLLLKRLGEHSPMRRRILLVYTVFALPDLDIARMLATLFLPERVPWYANLILSSSTLGLILLWQMIVANANKKLSTD